MRIKPPFRNENKNSARDHGGNVDSAKNRYGGALADWIDLSTGINPHPFPFTMPSAVSWQALPDAQAQTALCDAARRFWSVPDRAAVLAVPGASAAIAQIPRLHPSGTVWIPGPTYNEHAASFAALGWHVTDTHTSAAQARVLVHPNNPTGTFRSADDLPGAGHLTIIDESFCDIAPERSLVRYADRNGVLVLKSFGKFWGLAGVRLGFVIGDPALLARLAEMLGPWPVSGPALAIGHAALSDTDWAGTMRTRLEEEARRLDAAMTSTQRSPVRLVGGTPLFRLYDTEDAADWQDHLARHHIWSRIFPYSTRWLRLGLPPADRWDQIARAL